LVAVHADIDDADQTVKLVEPPKETPKQPTPKTPEPEPQTPTTATYTPKTGDALTADVLAVLALGSCLALGVALYAYRRSRRKATEGLLAKGMETDDADAPYWHSLYGGE